MTNAVMMERTSGSLPGYGTPTMGSPAGVPVSGNWMMVPRCTFKVERCQGGFQVSCSCDDPVACSMVQNLCVMLQGGMCSCCVMYNGMTICQYNFTMGACRCETTDKGVRLTCTSGDPACCAMLQACCDSLGCMLQNGCTCCLLMNNTPVCCGCSESCVAGTPAKARAGR
jgi:hypothetical protein